jgi:hypothetical protein
MFEALHMSHNLAEPVTTADGGTKTLAVVD